MDASLELEEKKLPVPLCGLKLLLHTETQISCIFFFILFLASICFGSHIAAAAGPLGGFQSLAVIEHSVASSYL